MSDFRGPVRTSPGDDKTAGHHRVTGALQDWVGLAGEQRLVDFETGFLDHYSIDNDLVPGPRSMMSSSATSLGGSSACPVRPAHQWVGLPDDREFVQRLFGSSFLHRADEAVGDDQNPEQTVDQRTGRQHDGEQHT